MISLFLFNDHKNNDIQISAMYTFIGIYVIYVITSLFSKTCSYLVHKQKNSTIHSYMINLFKTKPKINYSVNCYHYETRTYTTTDNEGNTQTHTETIRVNTYSETQEFYFKSFKDTSGMFILDMDNVKLSPKNYYIKLHLTSTIYPSNDGTMDDYIRDRDNFYNINRCRDTHMDTHENKMIDGFNEFKLVSVGDKKPLCVNYGCYFIFILIGFSELYKSYVNHFCIAQNFNLSKEFSSRRDLTSPEFVETYFERQPSIRIQDEIIKVDDPTEIFGKNENNSNSIPDDSDVENQMMINSPVINHPHNIEFQNGKEMTMQTQAVNTIDDQLPNENDIRKSLL